MKKIRKSTGVAIAFLIYVSVTAAYLLPRNTEVSQTEKILTVAGSYVIVLLLWLVLRKKEQMRERRKKDEQSIHLKNKFMKKLALALCLLAVSFTAQAQFEKGTMILNPSVTGLDFSYSKNDDAKFGIGAQAGTFLADGFALMVNLGADWSQPKDTYTLGTGMRCYFNTTGIYLGGGFDWERVRYKGGGHNNDWGLGIEAGYAYFLSKTVTIEPAVYYKWRFDDSDNSRFGVKIGFGFYF